MAEFWCEVCSCPVGHHRGSDHDSLAAMMSTCGHVFCAVCSNGASLSPPDSWVPKAYEPNAGAGSPHSCPACGLANGYQARPLVSKRGRYNHATQSLRTQRWCREPAKLSGVRSRKRLPGPSVSTAPGSHEILHSRKWRHRPGDQDHAGALATEMSASISQQGRHRHQLPRMPWDGPFFPSVPRLEGATPVLSAPAANVPGLPPRSSRTLICSARWPEPSRASAKPSSAKTS